MASGSSPAAVPGKDSRQKMPKREKRMMRQNAIVCSLQGTILPGMKAAYLKKYTGSVQKSKCGTANPE
jgi:hypothetical protein